MSDARLSPLVEWVERRAERALLTRLNVGYGHADPRVAGNVYLDNDAARARVDSGTIRASGGYAEALAQLATVIDSIEGELVAHPPLVPLSEDFGLGRTEFRIASLAIAYEMSKDVRILVRALAMPRPAGVYLDLCELIFGALPSHLLAAIHSSSPLHWLLEGGVSPLRLDSSIRVRADVIHWLTGDHRLPRNLDRVAVVEAVPPAGFLETGVVARISELAEAAEHGAYVRVSGPPGSGKCHVAGAISRALERPLLRAAIPAGDGGAQRAMFRELRFAAALRGAVLYVAGCELLAPDGDPWLDRELCAPLGCTVLGSRQPLTMGATSVAITLSRPDLDARTEAWKRVLAAAIPEEPDATAETFGKRYVVGPSDIDDARARAEAHAGALGTKVTLTDIEEALGHQLSVNLGSYATHITRRATLEEMVLSEEVETPLLDMIAMVNGRSRILEQWGYGSHLGLSRGVSALFSGKPGTGKTMAAAMLSGELGLELFQVDLSAVVSKWVGETEKHLGRIFDEAENSRAMLLFDEADSLFGKRSSEIKSASDRYANLEVNFLLQRMERFNGVSILTTNLESAIDLAFVRRLNFRIRFPEPEEDEREQLWRTLIPPQSGLAGAPEIVELARRFEMTGGHIRNAIVRAAVVAVRESRDITVADLRIGAGVEYAELGKVMPG